MATIKGKYFFSGQGNFSGRPARKSALTDRPLRSIGEIEYCFFEICLLFLVEAKNTKYA